MSNLKFFVASILNPILIGILVYFIQKYFDSKLQHKMESYKATINYQYNLKTKLDDEILRWANPILSSINGLLGRLNDIINNEGHVKLNNNDGYYIQSTYYYFAQYLCWVQILKEEINHRVFGYSEDQQEFLDNINNLRKLIRTGSRCIAIYSLEQRKIADMMITTDLKSNRTCLSYYSFTEKFKDETFRNEIISLLKIFCEITKNDDKYTRIVKLIACLQILKKSAEKILKNDVS